MEEAQELRRRGVDVLDLGPGQPDFPTPDLIKQAGVEAIERNFTSYTSSAGIRPLRQAVADSYNSLWGTQFSFDNVIVCAGAKPAIYNVCMAVFEEGHEVLVPSPYWVTFPEAVKLAGAAPVFVPTLEGEGFVLSVEAVRRAITPRTRGLVINSPNNPAGAVIPGHVLSEIVAVARQEGLFVLFDETYEHFTYGSHSHISGASLLRETGDDFAVISSFSKTYSMTGWRIGYCLGPRSLIHKLDEFQSHQSGNSCSISQAAALAALAGGKSEFERMRAEYEKRRDFLVERLRRVPGFRCDPPAGAFYLFPNVEDAMRLTGCLSSSEFSRFLLNQAHVATVPGTAFGCEGHIRISYATSSAILAAAVERIEAAIRGRLS